MVLSKKDAADKYRSAIEAFGGYSTYKDCGKPNNTKVRDIANCLAKAKTEKGTDVMVKRWSDAYE